MKTLLPLFGILMAGLLAACGANPPPSSASDSQAEQARSFAEPILKTIADRTPDFADDFSEGPGVGAASWGFAGNDRRARVTAGVAVVPASEGNVYFGHHALVKQDFILQVDSRVASGNPDTNLIVNFHNRSGKNWYYLSMNIGAGKWAVLKLFDGRLTNLAAGSGHLSPLGQATKVMIVARGTQGAVYLNGAPAGYFDDADFKVGGYTLFLCESGGEAMCEFDNVKLWDLAK